MCENKMIKKVCPLLTAGYLANPHSKIKLSHGEITSLAHVYCLRDKCMFWDKEHGCSIHIWNRGN